MNIITTQKIVHNADDLRRHKQLNLPSNPPKELVLFQFHIRDVKSLTQHILPEDDETQLPSLTLVQFYDGETVPVTEPFEELAETYRNYNDERDQELQELLKKKEA